MAKRLFVGNLPYSVDDEALRNLFSQIGEVSSASVIIDRATGRSKGFGFVEMAQDEDSEKAIKTLNGQEVDNRKMVVNEARPMEDRPRREFRGNQGNY